MKIYEKMTKEEIIEFYGNEAIKLGENSFGFRTVKSITEKLNQEIEMIPRAFTFRTSEEADKARCTEVCEKTDCDECKYRSNSFMGTNCAFNWLYEEIEK